MATRSRSRQSNAAGTNVTNVAFIKPAILTWALARTGFSHAQLADKINADPEQIAAWERGESRPTFDKAQQIAKELSVPLAFLFLSKPPNLKIPIPDLRTQADRSPLSLPFFEVVNDALVKQDWYRDFLKDSGERKLQFVGHFSPSDSPYHVAADIRRILQITPEFRRSAKDWGEYLSKLSTRAENAGILVMRSGVVGNRTNRKLSYREFQGFALSDPYAPSVFVNSTDFKAPQIFTLVHEIAHIWIGRNAISHTDPAGEKKNDNPIELFCNDVAVETLVPMQEFQNEWKSGDLGTNVTALSRKFWVSTLVILRRALELNKITRDQFFDQLTIEKNKYKKQPASGGDYYRNVTARMGSKFTSAVLTELRAGKLLYRDAAKLLRMKVPTLKRFSEHVK
jgi:Zn-dependent peptidase ImmA (M78 family)/DNA-binding XRE family transcriptional regulator